MKSNIFFKDSALNALRGNWGKTILATIVYVLIALAISGPVAYTSVKMADAVDDYSLNSVSQISAMAADPEVAALQKQTQGTSAFTFLAEIFLLLPMAVAFYNIFRKLLVNGDNNCVSNLFNFSNYWHKIGGMILMGILVFLWTLLFIIPGIIKTYSYAMTPYILDENPELSASEAIHRSRLMMNGHKFDLFWLQLSFIGWFLLCIVTFGIATLWITPYYYTAQAAFYEEVKADYALNGGLA